MGIPETTMNAIIAISSMTLIWLRSVFLIGGTPATDILTRMPTIPHRLTVTNIGKIWR
jgi:hypothetical protein